MKQPVPCPIKILSIRQPWASAIIHGGPDARGRISKKSIENRVWHSPFRGMLAIHASKSRVRLQDNLNYIMQNHGVAINPEHLVFGAIIGSVEMIDCVTKSKSEWFEGDYGFVLTDPFAYPQPIPMNGKLGIYRPDASIAKVLAALEKLRTK